MVFLSIEFSIGRHGGGTHQWDLSYKDVQYNRRYSNYGDIIYSLALFFTKLSIMLLILRIFCSVQRDVGYRLTQFLIAVNGIFYIVYAFIPIFLCFPRSKIWSPEAAGHCLDVNDLYLASAIFNVLSDIAMLSLPIYLIWNLQMSTRRKIGLSAIFLTGGLACIASILRLIYLVPLTRTKDYTYTKIKSILWVDAEIACGLLCSCLVVLPRLYQHLSSVAPNGRNGGLTHGMADQSTRVNAPSRRLRSQWVHLDGMGSPQSPTQAHKVGRNGTDEEALENAVEGY
ncbi:hypothetical protein HO173_002886 [Letharia columbiana]|uniref:Rhodopsin domain-containing protein n=1 Tax=Letharia columbiana TaxID=112416 RepID=A0A8H6G253_9LECA|nr:uncharacterized protein HO173_002886 [Letharia columbiana]KAF6239014.1 hypothetical protein HO173_002886 [Letharia columbiana]